MIAYCPLCKGTGEMFYNKPRRKYYKCNKCAGLFVPENLRPEPDKEKERYLEHDNDVNDPRYQAFVMPLVEEVLKDFGTDSEGLDFGAGTGPVVSKLLQDRSYKIHQYDPYFYPDAEMLNRTYDYIVSCEVVEHFYKPHFEFERLHSMLKPGGKLFCMTSIYDNHIDFNNWRYKNDHTHVFIYRKETFSWIKENLGFSSLGINNNVITLGR